jgi:hypothetical protein
MKPQQNRRVIRTLNPLALIAIHLWKSLQRIWLEPCATKDARDVEASF